MKGKRTITGLATATIPARTTFIMALLAIVAAIGLHVVAHVATIADARVGGKLHQLASTLEAMPLWVVIGGVMSQIAVRLNQAWDDGRAWWRRERMARQIMREDVANQNETTAGPFARRIDAYAEADLRLQAQRRNP